MLMDFPKTKDEWWELCIDNQTDLRNIVASFHPVYLSHGWGNKERFSITATTAEAACASVREDIATETTSDPLADFDRMLAAKDPELATLLGCVWFGIPESVECHAIKGFNALCDLASESYLILDEECRY